MFADAAQRAPNNPPPAPLPYEREMALWRARFREHVLEAEDAEKEWRKAARKAFSMGGED